MDAATQATYDRLRAQPGWLVGVGAIGSLVNTGVTVAPGLMSARWTQLYGTAAGIPASIEWEMGQRNNTATRDWASLNAYADAGGMPWVMISMNNFITTFIPGSPPPQGGMNDTTGRAIGVLPGGVANAAFVAYIQQLALEFKASNRVIMFRPLHEANGGWFWWGGHAANFRALWRLVFQTFQDADVQNVIWVWAAADLCGGGVCNAAAFYPGDDVVDVIGVDTYFDASALTSDLHATIASLEPIGLDKPVFIAELGPFARADFWRASTTEFAGIKRFRGFSMWLARGWNAWGRIATRGSLIDDTTDQPTRDAFAAMLADPRTKMLGEWR